MSEPTEAMVPSGTASFDHRAFLENRIEALEHEQPYKVYTSRTSEDGFFASKTYGVGFLNRSGTEVKGRLQRRVVGYMLILPMVLPGPLDTLEYKGLTVYDKGSLFLATLDLGDGSWTGLGRRSQHDVPIEEVKFGFDVYGENFAIYPYGNQDDAALADRIIGVFQKYGTFERENQRTSAWKMPAYRAAQRVRRIMGRLPQQQVALLPGPKE